MYLITVLDSPPIPKILNLDLKSALSFHVSSEIHKIHKRELSRQNKHILDFSFGSFSLDLQVLTVVKINQLMLNMGLIINS